MKDNSNKITRMDQEFKPIDQGRDSKEHSKMDKNKLADISMPVINKSQSHQNDTNLDLIY